MPEGAGRSLPGVGDIPCPNSTGSLCKGEGGGSSGGGLRECGTQVFGWVLREGDWRGTKGGGEGGVGMTLLFLTSPGLALSDTGKGVTGQVVCSYPFVPSSTYRDMGPTGTGGGTQSFGGRPGLTTHGVSQTQVKPAHDRRLWRF